MDDREIKRLFFTRSEQAISALSEKYGKLIYRIALNILSAPQDAEECENDTYLTVWDTVPPKDPDSMQAYAAKIARNIACDKLDYNTAQKRGGPGISIAELEECIPAPETSFDSTGLSEAIDAFLTGLNVQNRALFVGKYFCSESVKELARLSGLTVTCITTRLSRLREELRQVLEERGIAQ